MESFLKQYASQIKGVLSGFDRLRFSGTIRILANTRGLYRLLSYQSVLLKNFKGWAKGLTDTVLRSTEELAERADRRLVYLPSSRERKEQVASDIAKADGIEEGLICVLKCVEPCYSMTVGPNRERKRLEIRRQFVKCAHLYFYLIDPRLGPLHLRLQTWLPFNIHVCLNGREWLARSLRQRGIAYEQRDNCFVNLGDSVRAQKLADQQLRTDWKGLLNRLVRQVHPAHQQLFGSHELGYYWSALETEWATDVLFRSPETLAAVFPTFQRYAMTEFGSEDVLRFLGRCPQVRRFKTSEITTSLKTREEGTRIRHALNANSVKMYDKQGSVLRVETTINRPGDMKVFRHKEGEPRGPKTWQRLRKGVADLHRRAEISRSSNARYLEALAAAECSESLGDTIRDLCRPTMWQGRRVRALQPLESHDMELLKAVNHGEFILNGFRNRDLRALLFSDKTVSDAEAKRQAAKVTRQLRLLRAHRLIKKIPKTHRYQVTKRGRTAITAILAAQNASTQQLTQIAA